MRTSLQPKRPSSFHIWLSIPCFLPSVIPCLSVAQQWSLAIAIQYCFPYSFYFLHMSQMPDSSHLLVHSLSQIHLLNSPPVKVYDRLSVLHWWSPYLQSGQSDLAVNPILSSALSDLSWCSPGSPEADAEIEFGLQDICWSRHFCKEGEEEGEIYLWCRPDNVSSSSAGNVGVNLPVIFFHQWAKMGRPL